MQLAFSKYKVMPTLPSLSSLRAEVAKEEHPKQLNIMTITQGGLGNILFQWLATESHALSLAKTSTKPITAYLSGTPNSRPDITAYEMFSGANTFEKLDIPREHELYKEPTYLYRQIPTPQKETQVLHGYFQSWNYSYLYIRQLVSELRSHGGTALSKAEGWLKETREQHQGKRLVGIHARQGDYLLPDHLDYFFQCNGRYWERALQTSIAAGIIKGPEHDIIVIATEGVAAVKNMEVFKRLQADGYKILWLPPGDDASTTEYTFWTLAGMDSLLVSNSSFSLGAWMCRDREAQLVAPARWFGPRGPIFKINEIVPEDTLLIE
jgi:hypothetical protein